MDAETIRLAQEMRSYFMVPFQIKEDLSEIVKEAETYPPTLQRQVKAFCETMEKMHGTITLPYALALSNATQIHFQRFHIAARIRAIPVDPSDLTDEEKQLQGHGSYANAQKKLEDFLQNDQGRSDIIKSVSQFLLDAMKSKTNSEAIAELLYQGTVGVWSTFEVLARDGIIELLNKYPELSERLLNTVASKKQFELPKLSIDDLIAVNFDFSASMGMLIVGTRDFSDLRTIKAALRLLSDELADLTTLNDKHLWALNQDRHLIVHRQARVDRRYIESTGCAQAENERISISPEKLRTYFSTVTRAALSVARTLAALSVAKD